MEPKYQLVAFLPKARFCLVRNEQGELWFCDPLGIGLMEGPAPDWTIASACSKHGYEEAEPEPPKTMEELRLFERSQVGPEAYLWYCQHFGIVPQK